MNEWGEGVQRDMYELWSEHFSSHKQGIEVFTSPVFENPSVLFLGYNPGSRHEGVHPLMENKFHKGDFSLPTSHHYAPGGKDYPVAEALRNHVFKDREELLTDTIETNRYYLRTKDSDEHRNGLSKMVSPEVWDEYVSFCRDTLDYLMTKADPEVVVAFSIGTLRSLKDDDRHEVEIHEEHRRPSGNSRLFIEGRINDRPLLAFHHPSYWVEADKQRVEELMQPMLDSYF